MYIKRRGFEFIILLHSSLNIGCDENKSLLLLSHVFNEILRPLPFCVYLPSHLYFAFFCRRHCGMNFNFVKCICCYWVCCECLRVLLRRVCVCMWWQYLVYLCDWRWNDSIKWIRSTNHKFFSFFCFFYTNFFLLFHSSICSFLFCHFCIFVPFESYGKKIFDSITMFVRKKQCLILLFNECECWQPVGGFEANDNHRQSKLSLYPALLYRHALFRNDESSSLFISLFIRLFYFAMCVWVRVGVWFFSFFVELLFFTCLQRFSLFFYSSRIDFDNEFVSVIYDSAALETFSSIFTIFAV